MKRRIGWLAAAAFLAVGMMAGCGKGDLRPSEESASRQVSVEDTAPLSAEGEQKGAEARSEDGAGTSVRVGSLKGPTSMGLLHLMKRAESGDTSLAYSFTMVTAADELLAQMAGGQLDIALLPANTASILYQKTKGGVRVIDINTLGVLYLVSGDQDIREMDDLSGRTVYLTGKGTTPDSVMNYLLEASGVPDVTLEYKSEPAEVAALLKESPDAVGLLPQPFVTAACAQNEALGIVMDMTEQWDKLQGDRKGRLVTGVTVVDTDFLRQHEDAVRQFLKDHASSAKAANNQPEVTAGLVVEAGIIEKAPIAQQAIPGCNITCLTGEEMRTALSGYLEVLYGQDERSVGGELPPEDFYYVP